MDSSPVTVVAHAHAKEEWAARFKQHLTAIILPTRAEAGCMRYDLHQALDDPTHFVLYETWTDLGALERHFQMPYFVTLMANTAAMLTEPVTIHTLTRLEC